MIRVFVAEDHTLMREGLRLIIDNAGNMKITGEASNGYETLSRIDHTDCDVLMMDLSMPGMGGIDLIQQVRKSKPGLPILVMSMHDSSSIVSAAMRAGANGYITKNADAGCLPGVLRKIACGGRYLDPVVANRAIFEKNSSKALHEQLSDRERQVLLMIVTGKSTKQIASELLLSPKTVSTHKKRLLEKMGINNSAELVRYSIKHHLIETIFPEPAF